MARYYIADKITSLSPHVLLFRQIGNIAIHVRVDEDGKQLADCFVCSL